MQQMNFYCRSYCLLNMFHRHYAHHQELERQLENQAPNTTGTNHLYNTLELLMMGIMVPETC